MNAAKTPEQIAKMFGCTAEQARAQIASNLRQLESDAIKARASKSGKVRGLTAAWYEDRAKAFQAVL